MSSLGFAEVTAFICHSRSGGQGLSGGLNHQARWRVHSSTIFAPLCLHRCIHKENLGREKFYINEKVVAEGAMKTQLGKFTLSGDGLCVGFDSGDAVSQEYSTPGMFKGGTIASVEVAVDKAQYVDRQLELKRAARD